MTKHSHCNIRLQIVIKIFETIQCACNRQIWD